MIERVIEYLAELPTNSTSPLAVALNTSTMLETLGTDKVSIYSYDEQQRQYPYVLLKEHGDGISGKGIIGGGYLENKVMAVECFATGETPFLAKKKVAVMAMAVEGRIYSLKGTIQQGALAQTDLGGTGSYDQITDWWVKTSPVPAIGGPGTDTTNPVWVAKYVVKVIITTAKIRIP